MKRLIRFLLIACAATLAVGSLIAFAYRLYLERTAAALLADVEALKIGESSFADAQRIAAKYKGFRLYGNASVPASANPSENIFPEHTCNSDRCFFLFTIDDRPLAALRLAHGAAFSAGFAVLNGKVRYATVYIVGGPSPGAYGAFVQEIDAPPSDRKRRVFYNPVGKPYLSAKITSETPAVIREHVFALNLKCLVARTGCDQPCAYAPLAWNDWKTELRDSDWMSELRTVYPKCP